MFIVRLTLKGILDEMKNRNKYIKCKENIFLNNNGVEKKFSKHILYDTIINEWMQFTMISIIHVNFYFNNFQVRKK